MAMKMYEASFASVIPQLRPKESILLDIQKAGTGKAADASAAQVAWIELHIKNGEDYFRQGQYNAALKEFKQARSAIYKTLYPNYNSYASLGRVDVLLPTSSALEDLLIDVSVKIGDVIKPLVADEIVLYPGKTPPIPDDLKVFTTIGFKEESTLEELTETVSARAVGLLHDGNPAAAITVMEGVISLAAETNQRLKPELAGALQLNLATAYMQVFNTTKATEFGKQALRSFETVNDTVGQAQAMHTLGISATKTGDTARAKEFLDKASALVKERNVVAAPLILENRTSTILSNIPVNRASAFAVDLRSRQLVSQNLDDLKTITEKNTGTLTYRVPGSNDSWGTIQIASERQRNKNWFAGLIAGGEAVAIPIGNANVTKQKVVDSIYKMRVSKEIFSAIEYKMVDTSSTTYYLSHLYSYVLPVKIGDCYHELGKYNLAESYYKQATQYTYLNKNIEATLLWIKIARNAFTWGSSLYKEEKINEAKTQYSKIINTDATVPSSLLYNTASMKVPADASKSLITKILDRPLPVVNWEISFYVLSASAYLQQIFDGLDYYGLALSPIFTFEYLQSVSRSFCQEAIQAEREFINFKTREEMEEASRRELETAKAMAEAEADGRFQQYVASLEDEAAAKAAVDLAVRRRDDAVAQRAQYASVSADQIWGQAASQALGGGQDAYYSEISELADKLDRGETIHGPGPKLAAAETLSAGRKTRAYELQKMADNIAELTAAIDIAKNQWDSSRARSKASEIAWQAALQRSQMATEALTAFDEEFFTPESWHKMADLMRSISGSFLYRAIRIAKLMERSYNFENDFQLKIIKNDYGFNLGNPGSGESTKLLGGDSLLLDIESFTYHAITNKTRKTSRIKDIISIATDFPAHFDQFKNTGVLKFETDLYEFDRLHPGFYSQRIEAVELQFVGVLNSDGLNGTLTAGGVTMYRKKDGTSAKRVHQIDTMALSDFELRNDIFLYSTETGVRGLFQGFGVGSTWTLALPRRSNDIDFKRIFDVNLIIYYTAKFDPMLKTSVLSKPPRPGEFTLIRSFGLRYDFPDAWYAFYQAGKVQFNIERFRLPMNQKNFTIDSVHFRVETKAGISNQGLKVKVTSPSGASGIAVTNASGLISTSNPALASLKGGNPIGNWTVTVMEGTPITENGTLKYDRVYNIQMGLEYAFEYLPEII